MSAEAAVVPRPSIVRTFGAYRTSRENNYDFLRFALASAVVFAHAYDAVNRGAFDEPLLGFTLGQFEIGQLAVAGFFIISGLLVTGSWERSPNFYDFIKNRVLRIYPGFVVCWLICMFVVAPLSGLTWEQYRSQINVPLWIVKIALLRGFGGYFSFPANAEHMLNTSLWTIPYEFGCYLMVAALASFRRIRRQTIVAAAALSYVVVALGAISDPRTNGYFPSAVQHAASVVAKIPAAPLVCYFLMGAAFYILMERIVFSWKIALVALVSIVVAMKAPPLLAFVLPASLTYLLFFIAYHPQINFRGFGRRGDLSYGIYLYGWPIEQLLARFFEPWLNGNRLFLLAMLPVCGLAYASWKLVEQPFLRLKRRAPRSPVGSARPAI